MASYEEFARLIRADHGLCIVSVLRQDGTIGSSLVNAGTLPHPLTGVPAVAFVSRGDTRKVAYLRVTPRANVVVRAGWEWACAEGPAEIIGPDDPHPDVSAERLRLLLREVFTSAGGTHEDWDAYDRAMADERRAVVLVTPDRITANLR